MPRKFCVSALVCALAAPVALAGPGDAIIDSFTGGTPFAIFYGGSTGDVIGFRFTSDENQLITDLGVLDDPSDGVLDSAHMVGLWRNSDMALLASVSVDSTGTLLNGWYYESIAPVGIVAGGEYTLGAMYTATDNDFYISSPSSVTLNHVSGTNGVFPSVGSLGFVFPTNDSTNLARFGPNMIVIPEPSCLALFGLGLFLIRRR